MRKVKSKKISLNKWYKTIFLALKIRGRNKAVLMTTEKDSQSHNKNIAVYCIPSYSF